MATLDELRAAQQARRVTLQAAIAALPDEAFGEVAVTLWPRPGGSIHAIWEDGLGGFEPATVVAITAVLDAATRYCTQGDVGFTEEKTS